MGKKPLLLLAVVFAFTGLRSQSSYTIISPDHISLTVNEYGTGKPVILLAGGPGLSADYLSAIWKAMPGYRYIVPDQRGTGKSLLPSIDSSSISIARYVEDLEALRIHLKLSKLVLAGHSWGGMLAMAYTAKYPLQVEKLILLSPGGASATFFSYFSDNIGMRLYPEDRKESEIADSTGLNGFRGIWPGYFFSRKKALASKSSITGATMGQQVNKTGDYAFSSYAMTADTRVKGLMNYKGPVFLIQGRQDPVDGLTAIETKGYLPQTKLTIIEKCGHFPWLETEKAVDSFFKAFGEAVK